MKTLLIDLDPQGNTTTGIGIDKADNRRSIYEVMVDKSDIEDVIIRTKFKNLSIITSTINLTAADVAVGDNLYFEYEVKATTITSADFNDKNISDVYIKSIDTNLFSVSGFVEVISTMITNTNRFIDATGTGVTSFNKGYILKNTNVSYSNSTSNNCAIIDLNENYNLDEIAVWHYWEDGRTYNNNVTSVSSDNTTWTPIISTTESETTEGKRINAWKNYRLVNLAGNGNFTNPIGWSIYSDSVTNSFAGTQTNDGIYINDTSTSSGYWNVKKVKFVSTHKYYFSTLGKINSVTTGEFTVAIRNTSGNYARLMSYTTSSSSFVKHSDYFTASTIEDQIQIGVASTNVATGYIKNVMLIDLTETFGAGNEPEKDWCDENIEYFDGAKNFYFDR